MQTDTLKLESQLPKDNALPETGRRENQIESDTEDEQGERGQETRSHMLEEERCRDKTSDFRALPQHLAKACHSSGMT